MLYGKKVCLRSYLEEDAERAYEFINDPEVKRLTDPNSRPFPVSLEEEREWIRSNKSTSHEGYTFAIDDLDTGKYIGGCGINHANWQTRVATIGIMIGDKDYWGKGYGTDAISTLNEFIFEELNFNKIRLNVFSFNTRAIKCYEKCGFQVEGVLKQEIFKNGTYYDKVIMSLFKDKS